MNATTQVGTTANLLGIGTVKAAVFVELACWGPDFNKEAVTEEYRAEINRVAPAGFDLVGDIIVGDPGMDVDSFYAAIDSWRHAIDEIDFWRIVFRH
ncbi:MAG: hypothetical protein WCS71_05320 [Sphaerochaetaceae bacterium]